MNDLLQTAAPFLTGIFGAALMMYMFRPPKDEPPKVIKHTMADEFLNPAEPKAFYGYDKNDVKLVVVQPCDVDGNVLQHESSHMAVPFIKKDGVLVNVETVWVSMNDRPRYVRMVYDGVTLVFQLSGANSDDGNNASMSMTIGTNSRGVVRKYQMLPGIIQLPNIILNNVQKDV